MRPVSEKQKQKFGTKCIICLLQAEQHHPLKYAGRQIDEISVPLCYHHHRGNFGNIFKEAEIKSEIKAIEENLEYLIKTYPKYDWKQRLIYLKG